MLYLEIKELFSVGAAERTTQYASIDNISLEPDPVKLPGNLTVGGHIQINKDITSHGLKMNVEIDKILLGIKTKMPCVSKVGSWYVYSLFKNPASTIFKTLVRV